MGPLRPFFHLTSTFFGLTSSYKFPLLEEIFLCTQHLKGFSHSDVLNLPTYERRFYLNLLTREATQRQEQQEAAREQAEALAKSGGKGKGNRTTRVSGDALKNRMSSGSVI